MNLNVFNWSYSKRYYLTHPWKWFKELWYNIKAAYRRVKYGWCYCDVWNWDDWFCSVVPPMLRHMADHGSAYPGHPPFETPEKWHDWLHEMAHLIETADETWQDEHNEYHEEYMEHIMDDWNKEPSELSKNYMKRSQELAKEGEDNVRRALENLGQFFYSLWD
jgi:hypothetical protein